MKYLLLTSILLLFASCGTDSLSPNEADITFSVTQDANEVTDLGFKSVVEVQEIHSSNIEFVTTSIARYTIEVYSDKELQGTMRAVIEERDNNYFIR